MCAEVDDDDDDGSADGGSANGVKRHAATGTWPTPEGTPPPPPCVGEGTSCMVLPPTLGSASGSASGGASNAEPMNEDGGGAHTRDELTADDLAQLAASDAIDLNLTEQERALLVSKRAALYNNSCEQRFRAFTPHFPVHFECTGLQGLGVAQ